MCNCYEEQLAKLKLQYGDVAGFEHFWKDGITVSAWYKPMTKKGRPSKHASYISIKPTYCPFCGKPYEKKGNPKFNAGDLVAIPFRHMGGEIVRVNPDNKTYAVRLTSLNPFTGKTNDHVEIFGEKELEPLPKTNGIITL